MKDTFLRKLSLLKITATKLQNVSISYSEISHVRDEQASKVQDEITQNPLSPLRSSFIEMDQRYSCDMNEFVSTAEQSILC